MVTALDQFLFAVLPYILLILFFGFQAYRWITNRYAWTTRSSEVIEKQVLGVTSIPFHYGMIFLLIAHVIGVISVGLLTLTLLNAFNFIATIAGSVVVYAVAILFARRVVKSKVRAISKVEDYVILAFLIAIPTIGLYQIHVNGIFGIIPEVSVWIQSVFIANPNVAIMANLPLLNKIHITLAMIFFCYWPFTKLVHVSTYPITYIYRRYQVMRKHQKIFT